MRKILPLLLLALVVISCKKKTDDGTPANPLIGNWLIKEIDVSGNVMVAGTPLTFTGDGANMVGGYNLKADGTMTYDTKYDLVINITGLGAQTIPMDQSGSGTWVQVGNDLVITDQNGKQTYPIKVVTSSILILDQDTVVNQGGFVVDLNLEMTLRK